MKKFVFTLFCILSLLIPCQNMEAQGNYIHESFESTFSTLPEGWRILSTMTGFQWEVYPATTPQPAYDGSRYLSFNSFNSPNGYTSIVATPSIMVNSSNMEVVFAIKNPTGGDLDIYVSTDSGATYLNNPLDSNLVGITDWTLKNYSLSNYVGQSVCIVFYSVSNFGNGDAFHYLDNFYMGDAIECARPKFLNYSSTQNSATIDWVLEEIGDASNNFIMTVVDQNDSVWINNQNITIVPTNGVYSYTISGLSAGEQYSITLNSDCSAASKGNSLSNFYNFHTMCSSVSLPFSADFDSENAEEDQICWQIFSAHENTHIYSDRFTICTQAQSPTIVVSPQINHAANDMEVEFDITGDIGSVFQAGLMSNPNDSSTFEVLYTDTIFQSGEKKYFFNTANTSNGTATDMSFAFKFLPLKSSIHCIFLDNVNIHTIPTCSRVKNVTVEYIDTANVKLAWELPDSYINFQIELTSDSSQQYFISDSNSIEINNLIASTNYTARVRTICSANDTSDWSPEYNFKTRCGAASLPFEEDFNSSNKLPDCWTSSVLTFPTIGNGLITGWEIALTSNAHSPSGCLQSPDSRAGTRYLLCSPAISLPDSQRCELNFWMKRNSSLSKYERIKVYVNTKPVLEGALLLDSIHNSYSLYPVEETYGYFNYYYYIPYTGVVYILFESIHNYSSPMYLDDISVIPSTTCRTGLISDDISRKYDINTNQLQSSWNNKNYESPWLVNFRLVDKNSSAEVCNIDTVVPISEFNFNLTPYTQSDSNYTYYLNIRRYCNVNDTATDFVEVLGDIHVPCEAYSLPFRENFASEDFPPSCWSSYTDPSSYSTDAQWTYTSDSYYSHTIGSAKFPDSYSTTIGYLTTPPIYFDANTEYSLVYYQSKTGSYGNKFREGITVWLSKEQNDTTNAIKVGFSRRYDANNIGVVKMDYTFTVPDSGAYFVIFQATQEFGAANAIDDIYIRVKPTCFFPENNISILNVLVNEAQICLKDTVPHIYEIYYLPGNENDIENIISSGTKIVKNITPTDSVVSLSGLIENTEYSFIYRVMCDSVKPDYSDWSDINTFNTLCEIIDINDTTSFVEGFENFTEWEWIEDGMNCYSVYDDSGIAFGEYSEFGFYPVDGDKQLAVEQNSSGIMTRYFNLKAGKVYKASIYGLSYIDSTRMIFNDYANISFLYREIGGDDWNYILKESSISTNEYKMIYNYFSVPDTGIYELGIQYYGGISTIVSAFDIFKVEEVDCAPPVNIEIISILDTAFTATMQGEGTEWEIRLCSQEPDVFDANPVAVYTDTINTTTFTINGLNPGRQYWLITRSFCSDGMSEWSAPLLINTNCQSVDIPYLLDFEDDDKFNCWDVIYPEDMMHITNKFYELSYNGSSSLLVLNSALISPEFNVASLANCMVSGAIFNIAGGTSHIMVGVASDPNDMESFIPISSVTINSTQNWKEFYVDFSNLNNMGNIDSINPKHIILVSTGSFVLFDDIYIDTIPSCMKVTDVQASIVAEDSIGVFWTPVGNDSIWYVEYHKVTDKGDYVVGDTVVTEPYVVVGDLEVATKYYFNVRAICAIDDTSFIAKSNVIVSPCGVFDLPYLENKFTSYDYPYCWDSYYNNDGAHEFDYSPMGKFFYSDFNTGGNCADTAYLSTPAFRLKTNNGIIVHFDGYMSTLIDSINPPVLYTFDGITFDTLNVELLQRGTRGVKSTYIPNVGPGVMSFIFVSEEHSEGGYNIYGMEVEEIENCSRPQDVTFNVSDSIVVATIVDSVSTNTQYEYVYGIGDFDPEYATPTLVSGNSFTLSDLKNHSTYYVYVRTYCSDTEHSSWWKPYTFETQCVNKLVYSEVHDILCEGDLIPDYGFNAYDIVSDTIISVVVKGSDGCDSLVMDITIDFIPTVYVDITETINEGESYEFAGNTYTQAGTYEGHFFTDLGCDSIVTLTLIVTTPVDNAYALPIIVAPNPVLGGQSTFVNREWTAEEQNGMRVEVLNAVGQVMDVFTPATFPIEVDGIYTSGVYYIRVTSGTGEVYLGRLVVK